MRVERLARSLHVSKGSFYWNFKDRDELLGALLDEWERRQTAQIIEESARETPGVKRLERHFLLVAGRVNVRLEASVRAWAHRDGTVAERVAAVEQQRIDFVARQFMEAGFEADEAQRRALTAYLTYLGWGDWVIRNPGLGKQARSLAQYLAGLLMTPVSGK